MSSTIFTSPAGAVSACVVALCRIVCSAGQGIWRGRHPAIAPLAPLIVARLHRIGRRFRSLLARHEAGTLQSPKPRPACPASSPEPAKRSPDPLPRGDAWLLRMLMRPETEQARMDLVAHTNNLLAEIAGPAMQALIADAPTQVGRLLRPLLRMTRGEAEIPECLRLPARPKRQRPKPSPRPWSASRPKPARGEGAGAKALSPRGRGLGEGAAPAPPSTPQPAPQPEKSLWRVVPVIRVVWPKPNVVRIRAGPRFSRD